MTLAVMQAYFFPYLGYFQLIQRADHFVIYPHVSFRKRSWINRNYVLLRGEAKPRALTVPVSAKSSHQMMGATMIQDHADWRQGMMKTLFHGFKNAAYFEEVFPIIEPLLAHPTKSLHAYNAQIITTLARKLGIVTPIDSDAPGYDAQTLTAELRTELPDDKTRRVVGLCQHYGANTYLNPIGGVELYDRTAFAKGNVYLEFLERRDSSLMAGETQVGHSLSIIDPLMHLGFAEVSERLNDYHLV